MQWKYWRWNSNTLDTWSFGLIGKDSDARKDWRQKAQRETEDEAAGWHQWLNGHESEHSLGDSEGQGSLACCSPWGHRESDTTGSLNNNSAGELCAELLQVRFCELLGRCEARRTPSQFRATQLPLPTLPITYFYIWQRTLCRYKE